MPDSVPQPVPPSQAAPQPVASVLSFDDFKRVQLVIGEIKEVADHPNANKLFVLKVDLGGGQVRQLVAGLRGAYEPSQLMGRQVVVVANLAPATIRGQQSEGMLLAAEGSGGAPVLLVLEKPVAAGSKVR